MPNYLGREMGTEKEKVDLPNQEGRLRPKAEDNAEARSARRGENGQIEGKKKTRKQLKDRYGVKAQGKGID